MRCHSNQIADLMTLDALLALGLLCTTATQLRVVGPFGPGEIFLVIWIGLTSLRLIIWRGPLMVRALREVLAFWGIFICTLCIGTLVGLATHEAYDPVWFMHDVFAYALLLTVSTLSVAGKDAMQRLRRAGWALAVFGSAALLIQVAAGFGLPIGLFEPWFWERFRGWSDNPNQLAFACAALMLLAVHLAETASHYSARLVAICCLPLPIIVGRLTGSDTFLITAVAAVPSFLLIKLRSWALEPQSSRFRTTMVPLAALSLFGLTLATLPVVVKSRASYMQTALSLSKGGGKEVNQEANLRFMLWREAIERTISTAGMGLGPGPHLEIPSEIVLAHDHDADGPGNTIHPKSTGAMNFEAHNTVLDLMTQGGVIGVLAFIWLQGVAILRAWKGRFAGLTTLLCALLLFGMTNLIVRLPLFWYAIALCLVAHRETQELETHPSHSSKEGMRMKFALGACVVAALTTLMASGAVAESRSGNAAAVLHYAPNHNFDSHGHFRPASLGFDLADVNSVSQLAALPANVKALVWVGLCSGSSERFVQTVSPYAGHPGVFGFYLADDPNPSGSCPPARLRAEFGLDP